MTPPTAAAALALAIAAGAASSLWWLLRREPRASLAALAALTLLALGVRLLWPTDFPAGLNEDEPKVLAAGMRALRDGRLLAESNISVPVLMHALFQATLVPLFGTGQWTIRLYSLLGGTLCVPAAFAAARGLGLSAGAGLAGAALIAVLPWALFYSRVMQGAELNFQQLLLIAALARLLWRGGGAGEALLGAFAVAWMSYGYWCTRAMWALPPLAALLARGRARLWCLATLAGLLAYLPYVRANPRSQYLAQGLSLRGVAEGAGLAGVVERLGAHAHAFVAPAAQDGWLTVAAAAQHPWPLLLLAAAGLVAGGWRRGAFLAGGFLAGLAPSVLAWGPPSTHRMMMAFPFVALAAAAALDALRGRLPRGWRLLAAAVVLATAVWSLRFYYSDAFWRPESRWRFDAERTALVAALPLAPGRPVLLMRQVTQFGEPRRWLAADDRTLTADAWLPGPEGGVYAFTGHAAPLRPLYESLFGPGRVRAFGGAFIVDLPAGDWSALHQHGWRYRARCAAATRSAVVPALFQPLLGFDDLACGEPTQHAWGARWAGPPARLRLQGGGQPLSLETPRARVEGVTAEADVLPGDLLRAATTSPPGQPWPFATLLVVGRDGESVPAWEWVEPEPETPPS